MPNIKSAEKRALIADKKRLENKKVLSEMKTAVKKFNTAISSSDIPEAERLLPLASHAIDSAAVKGTIHKNKANHAKSQIGRALHLLRQGIVVVKADAKTLKQAEQKAAAQRRIALEEEAKKERSLARAEKERAKAPAKKSTAKKASEKSVKKTTKAIAKVAADNDIESNE